MPNVWQSDLLTKSLHECLVLGKIANLNIKINNIRTEYFVVQNI